ncbi:MAG: hypothetical protein ACI9YT_000362 [Halobacteriales archaeon]|jgi:hypothetical protein
MGLVRAVRIDLKRFHETWMELFFPRQVDGDDTVLGKWKPTTQGGWIKYRIWAAIGSVAVAIGYPLTLLGYFLRFQTRRIEFTATRLGTIGVLILSLVAWGALTAVARVRFSTEGFIAVGAAAIVATVAAVLAFGASQVAGRKTTVFVAYPLGVTAIFLPPVVAALVSPTVGEVLDLSYTLAEFSIEKVQPVVGIGDVATYLRDEFDLIGIAYIAMWVGISIPVGWVLGVLVTLAEVVRPTD